MSKRIGIIGAGAAGCFCAIETKRRNPDADVHIFERATKALAKVAVTGGGRCNLTNSFRCYLDEKNRLTNLQAVYPRGDKLMRRMLSQFSHEDTMEWFENEGVALTIQDDECVFPESQDAMEIVTTLLRLINHLGIHLHLSTTISKISKDENDAYRIDYKEIDSINHNASLKGRHTPPPAFDTIVVTTGGSPKSSGLSFLQSLNIDVVSPVPSLFTFNIEGSQNQLLMGTVVEDVAVMLSGTRHRASGPLLWTHWGVSGPAVLRLSSYAARDLESSAYRGTLVVNWCGEKNENEVRDMLQSMLTENANKTIANVYPTFLTQKHWQHLLEHCSIPLTQRWGALNKTHVNRLVAILTSQQLRITSRSQWKEEFVTCGGVSLSAINNKTLESKQHSGLFFAGEVLDVDAITGGFNLQAAWSMAMAVAKAV